MRDGLARPARLERVVDTARGHFARRGLRATRMADIADTLDVSVGSLYTYAASKEGLFDLVLKRTLARPGYHLPSKLPAPHRTPEQTVRWLRRRLDFTSDFPLLDAAGQPPHPLPAAIAGELFDVSSALAPGFEVLERSAPEVPELLPLFLSLRRGLIERLGRWIDSGSDAGVLRRVEDPSVTSRLVLEAALWASQRRRRDRESRGIDDAAARAALVELVTATLQPFPATRASAPSSG
jgi:AcrR family transcriptional regulator